MYMYMSMYMYYVDIYDPLLHMYMYIVCTLYPDHGEWKEHAEAFLLFCDEIVQLISVLHEYLMLW